MSPFASVDIDVPSWLAGANGREEKIRACIAWARRQGYHVGTGEHGVVIHPIVGGWQLDTARRGDIRRIGIAGAILLAVQPVQFTDDPEAAASEAVGAAPAYLAGVLDAAAGVASGLWTMTPAALLYGQGRKFGAALREEITE